MKKIMLLIASLFTVQAFASQDGQQQPERVNVPLAQAYIPGGFDSNDRTQLVVEGFFPSTCYRVGPYEKVVNSQTKEVTVKQTAYKYRGQCLFMMVPFQQSVQVGFLKANNYTVKDVDSGRSLGDLPVKVATSTNPDDFTYAMVSDAFVSLVDGNKRAIVIQGELPGDCWQLKEKRLVQDGKNVLTVMPIIEEIQGDKRPARCNDFRLPFVTTVDLPAANPGRYLLHVRSLNGAAVNKLVDL